MQLKEQIIILNEAYRDGKPLVSDEAYDTLLEKYKQEVSEEEYQEFRESLTEPVGNTKSGYVLGSLEKYKYEEPESFYKWFSKTINTYLFVSEKVDGVSFYAKFKEGKLVSCLSRGNGIEGVDWTDKAKHIFSDIDYKHELEIRGEFTIHAESLEELGFKNTRNGTCGIMNSKEVEPEKLQKVYAYVYEIINFDVSMSNQFKFLLDHGFKTPKYYWYGKETKDVIEKLKYFYLECKSESPYAIDGVVLSDDVYQRENEFIPKNKVAFKINEEGKPTKVKYIEWNVSKSGAVKPVLVVEPIELNGTTVQRATAYHADYVLKNEICEGTVVKIQKSGEIIPKVTDIIKNQSNQFFFSLIEECPCCNSKLEWRGVDLICTNEHCSDVTVKQVEHFVKSLEIDNVSETSLKNWGITTFEKLFTGWIPDNNYKTQVSFHIELIKKVYACTPSKLMKHFPINGIGKRNYDKMFQYYGCSLEEMNEIFNGKQVTSYPSGIGQQTIENGKNDWKKYYEIMRMIYNFVPENIELQKEEPTVSNQEQKLKGKSFLLTGTMSRKRSVIEQEIVEYGGMIASSVSKNLSYLIAASEESTSSKYKKATQLGVPIISEDEYLQMIA